MSNFTSTLIVSPLPDGKTWVIRSPFEFKGKLEVDPKVKFVVNVPVGFETDFASVPRVLWWIFSPWDDYGNAAVIHDWLYWDQNKNLTRKESDDIFLEGMKQLNVASYKQFCLYHAVRLFGWLAWWRNGQLKQQGDIRVNDQITAVNSHEGKSLVKPEWRKHKNYRASTTQARALINKAKENLQKFKKK
jgi:hypothetical protein